jgi:DNA helicase HerA-like ATPase
MAISLDPDLFMNEHIVTFGVTRFGKSHTNAVIVEEFAKANRPVFTIDPHSEYYARASERQQNVWLRDMAALEEDTRGRAGQVFQEKTA